MNQKLVIGGGIALLMLLLIIPNALFTVDERQKALILQFGELQHVYDKPGLKVKIPFIQEVIFYDRRLLGYNLPPIEVTAGDQKRMVVDLYVRYVISDPLLFYKTIGMEEGALNRLSSIVPGSMRRVIGRTPLSTLLSRERGSVMDQIHKEVRKAALPLGMDVKDVRIVRADLPQENGEAIFQRMVAERNRKAKLFRAEGEKKAQEIRSTADRQRTEIIANAQKKSEILRGQGDALAIKNYAEAYQQDPKFFEFYRSMQAYLDALSPDSTTYILSPESDFFKYFETPQGK
ncbi:MAG: protease modulator HflC [Alphaproteobacteria bacterium]|nr:protease modulator HflC [Alphaproteobacteria bacterium]